MDKKYSQSYPVSMTINGKEFIGERVVYGTNRMSQTICYKEFSKIDKTTYIPNVNAYDMPHNAKFILCEILSKNNIK